MPTATRVSVGNRLRVSVLCVSLDGSMSQSASNYSGTATKFQVSYPPIPRRRLIGFTQRAEKKLRNTLATCQNEYREVVGMSNVIRLSCARTEEVFGLDEERTGPLLFMPLEAERTLCPSLHSPGSSPKEPEDLMLDELDRRDRLRLVEFVCSFAWADLEIQPEERVFISRLIRRLELDEEEDLQVQQWLDRPPNIDGLDPTSIPSAHRLLFVEAIEGLISADGEISVEEQDSFEIFKQLLAD